METSNVHTIYSNLNGPAELKVIVCTENVWLYAGLEALLSGAQCKIVSPNDDFMPNDNLCNARLVIVIDCLIFLKGEWEILKVIKSMINIKVIWLSAMQTGLLFPIEYKGDRIIHQKDAPSAIRRAIFEPSGKIKQKRCNEVKPVELTRMQFNLIHLFSIGISVPALAKFTNHSAKTMYSHRRAILKKTGFRTITLFQNFYNVAYRKYGESILKEFFICKS